MRKSDAPEQIANAILVLRGHRVLLDAELAALYGVTTKRLNEQVKRNAARFPADFIFRLTPAETVTLNRSQKATGPQKHRGYSAHEEETSSLRSQIATLKTRRGQHRKYSPYAFTEHGAIMAATILSSPRAVEMTVHVERCRESRIGGICVTTAVECLSCPNAALAPLNRVSLIDPKPSLVNVSFAAYP
jgi:hypothetical protein